MGNKEYVDAANTLINTMNRDEYGRMMNHAIKKYPDIFESKGFQTLKKSKRIFGGVGKCLSFLPIGIQIEGWFLPTNNYDAIEIYCGDYFCGYAELGISRLDVYNNFPFFNEKEAGFSAFFDGSQLKQGWENPYTILVKKNGKVIFKNIISLDNYTVEDSLKDLNKSVHTTNNIWVPTLSNRLQMILSIAKKMPEYNFIASVEGMENKLEDVINVCKNKYEMQDEDIKYMSLFMVPKVFQRNFVPSLERTECSKELFDICNANELIQNAGLNFSTKYNVSLNYAYRYCYEAIGYIEKVISIISPKAILIWNQYSPWHQMIEMVAKERGIPVIHMENGVLPGTLIFETEGQMGESYPARHSEEFLNLKVNEQEIKQAEEIRTRLFVNKLNRWTSTDASVYDKDAVCVVREQIKTDRPTIFYAGQNDFESGLFPYTEYTKEFHSPVFESSEEAAIYLGKLAKRNNWNLIYKRHPMMRGKLIANLPENIIVSNDIDIHDAIDLADLTITILSQTSYVAMIRNKPVVMLGYHQLCHKGCIYEGHVKEEIEEVIKKALKEGLTSRQNAEFNKHIAQLCKYYLYADFLNEDIEYGKTLNDLEQYISNVVENNQGICGNECVETLGKLKKKEEVTEIIVSPFYFDLSISERLQRYKIKRMLIKSELNSYICNCQNRKELELAFMYIAQIDALLLEKFEWASICKNWLESLLKKELSFGNTYEWILRLNPEVIKRLKVDKYLQETLLKFMVEGKNLVRVLHWSLNREEEKWQKVCFENIQKYLAALEEDRKVELVDAIQCLLREDDISEREKMYLFELLHKYNLITSEDIKRWNKILQKSQDEKALYYYGVMEMDRICFLKPECRYPEYYEDRRKMLIHSANVLANGKRWEIESRIEEENKRIAILVVGLHGKKFASTRLQVGVANELAKRGWKVTIFVADTNYINSTEDFIIPPETVRFNFSKTCYQYDHWEMLETDVNVQYFVHQINDAERYQMYIDSIYQFNPFAIIDITNEQAVYNPQLKKDFPVIVVPLNGYVSSAECDAYVARNIEMMKEEQRNFAFSIPKYVSEANLYIPYESDNVSYRRETKGFAKSDFLVVTVGNRLNYEITDEVKRSMKDILDRNRNLKWIIVGKVNSDNFKILESQINRKQVLLWGYENNLAALYKMCNVYLDMPRSGGGGSTAFAVQCGLPAIILNIPSDILPFLGEETSVENWELAIERLLTLINSKKECRALAKVQDKNLRSKEWRIEHFVDVLENAMFKVTKGGK